MSTAVLDIQSLSIQRDGTAILRDVSWRVMPGEHWVILGPNGCGKTSLLAALTGYFMPTSGDIDLLGERYGESDWRQLRLQQLLSNKFFAAMLPLQAGIFNLSSG